MSLNQKTVFATLGKNWLSTGLPVLWFYSPRKSIGGTSYFVQLVPHFYIFWDLVFAQGGPDLWGDPVVATYNSKVVKI